MPKEITNKHFKQFKKPLLFKIQYYMLILIAQLLISRKTISSGRLSGRVREVLSELDKMKKVNDEELYALEEIVNSFKDDVMKKLREDFPRFKDEDFKLMCYWYAGFSPAAMCVLMKIDEISYIYKRKSQLFF